MEETMAELLAISAIIPTRNRREAFTRMLASLALQSSQPVEMIVVDASANSDTKAVCESPEIDGLATKIRWLKAEKEGAAAQRNQGIKAAAQEAILFADDDVSFEPECILRLWQSLNSDSRLGGVSSMIVNQKYDSPGFASRWLFRTLNGQKETSYAGKCIGPALNLLPEDRTDLPETVAVEWLNTTCTLYRKKALPEPLFSDHFTGYSLMEDVALSLSVGVKWKLANARLARIHHDSQNADYKDDKVALAKMQLVNRHFVMTHFLKRNAASDYAKLALLEAFQIATPLRHSNAWRALPAVLLGKFVGLTSILQGRGRAAEARMRAENRKQVVSN
jgi:glycosyltransferase involved in cell wall biosynthesis